MAPASDSLEHDATQTQTTLSDLVLHTNGNGAAHVKSETGSNGAGYVPYGITMVERRPPAILGLGTANPPNTYRMEDFAQTLLRMPNFTCPPEAAGFIERICKHTSARYIAVSDSQPCAHVCGLHCSFRLATMCSCV
jgi:hypothetical protein